METHDENNPIFSRLPHLLLAILTPAILAFGSLFFQNQITSSRSETRITYLENLITEIKLDIKDSRRTIDAQLQSIDSRLRQAEQKR